MTRRQRASAGAGGRERPIDRVARALEAHGSHHGGGSSWTCPAHDDRRASLSVSEGDDGRVLLYCHAGCQPGDVVRALGRGMPDLFPDEPAPTRGARGPNGQARGKGFETFEDAVASVERLSGARLATHWSYIDAAGREVARVARFDPKSFRPFHGRDGRWYLGDPPGPLPLYRLPELDGAERILVVEGEGCVDVARELDLVATTSAHGARSARKADWSPLAGRDVAIFPDADDAGEHYAQEVVRLLKALDPPARVCVVHLPEAEAGDDIVDFVARRRGQGATDAEIRAEIETLVAEAPDWTPPMPADPRLARRRIEAYAPFPLHILPRRLRRFADAVSASIGCDVALVALPALGAVSGLIGNIFVVRLKAGWEEPASLWLATVAPSGAKKTPAFDAALGPLAQIEGKWLGEYAESEKKHAREKLEYERDLARWKKEKGGKSPPEAPEEPVARRIIMRDVTVEALAVRLVENPRGLLLARDELSGWLGSFDAYKNARGADVAAWLQAHRCGAWTVDRKGKRAPIYIPRVCLSIVGTIQPEILCRALGDAYFENGLAARLLLAMPPVSVVRWNENGIGEGVVACLRETLDRIAYLEPSTDCDGRPQPVPLGLTDEAKAAWVEFYNEHADEQATTSGALAAAWSKLEGYAARLALVLHVIAWAENDDRPALPGPVSAAAMKGGITLARWFGCEARRIYAALRETPAERKQRKTLELLQRIGSPITARDLAKRSRLFADAAEAEAVLSGLVGEGYGSWREVPPGPRGGRRTRLFALSDDYCVGATETPKPSGDDRIRDEPGAYDRRPGVSPTGFADSETAETDGEDNSEVPVEVVFEEVDP